MYNVNSLWYVYVRGAEKKILGWRNDILGPGKKRWLTPSMYRHDLSLSSLQPIIFFLNPYLHEHTTNYSHYTLYWIEVKLIELSNNTFCIFIPFLFRNCKKLPFIPLWFNFCSSKISARGAQPAPLPPGPTGNAGYASRLHIA